ncbi:hypothetical protein [Aphanothece sacrum]|uniref:Uncharacterized protein n=1 Tax=Aphanothece sacrum FPU1 TaxID=1920663 RepID=A0A401IMK6_APHSA|nr:hypothetical protein [Aphanothece sacrum]GBF82475.1 hypothetical protein AsFPU1_3904 [Aphanothece sacrum FPU1]GBF84370.1 hypothetical protein AsFPU3_1419 [Aphanothece sacrum FPU3]
MATKTSITNSQSDLKQIIRLITKRIVGETCHKVLFRYGDELLLAFGEMTPYSHPKLAHLYKGSWRLGTRATPWICKHNNHILVSSTELDSEEKIQTGKNLLKQLENKKLHELIIDVHNIGLNLCFENNYQLILEPDLQDDSGLTYWELFMPTEQILTVGPGFFWECKSIHERC